MCDY